MKVKTKLIASIMSICLVCAVFAIGVFALKTANLKIGGDVSFQATGVEAHIKNASVSGTVTPTTLAANDAEGEVINTSMTQADIDTTFQNWQTLELDFDENATDIELKFDIANTSTNADNYIEIDYSYSFSNANPNVDVFPGDENAQQVWENNEYILAPKGATPADGDYETFTLKFKVLDKELNVPQDTKVSVNIELKHITPVSATGVWNFVANSPNAGEATLQRTTSVQAYTAPNNWNGVLEIPAVVTDGVNNYVVTKIYSVGGVVNDPSDFCFAPSETTQVAFPNSIKEIEGCFINYGSSGTSIELPKSLTSIGAYAFSVCSSLISITIPNSVTSIGEFAFYSTTGLTSITIPSSVTSIGSSAFHSCTGLTSITIPSSVTSIGGCAFQGCSSLSSITIPSSVTSIGEFAFASCSSLTSVIIGDGVTSIGNEAFAGCSSLTTITIPSSVTRICGCAFQSCSSLSSITIPSSVTIIGGRAFYECSSLTTITIPSSVTSIEIGAFSDCNNLTSVKFEETTGWWYADSANSTSGTELTISETDFAANATLLKTTYYNKYWFRTAV